MAPNRASPPPSPPSSILQWNCRGAIGQRTELMHYLDLHRLDPPAVICLQETLLTPKKHYHIPGYNIIRKDRNIPAGGLLIAIKNNLNFTIVPTPNDIEVMSIKLTATRNLPPTYIVNLYNPPRQNIDLSFINNICNLNNDNLLILGDFNAHHRNWHSNIEDATGKYLVNFFNTNSLHTLNDSIPTHIHPNGTCNLLDLTISNNKFLPKLQCTVLNDTLGSDHYPINIKLNHPLIPEQFIIEKYNYKNADWKAFKRTAFLPLDKIQNDDNDIFYNNIIKAIQQIADETIPKIIHDSNSTNKRRKLVPYWTEKCKEAVHKRKIAQNKFKFYSTNENFQNYKSAKADVQKTIRREKITFWERYTSTLTKESKITSIWKMAKKMSGNNSQFTIPTLVDNNIEHSTPIDKANLFAKHFAAISSDSNFAPQFTSIKKPREEAWKNVTPSADPSTAELNDEFSLFEIKRAIRQTHNLTAPGVDTITYELLKHLPNSALETLLVFYNQIWSNQILPHEWKKSLVIPILKSGELPSNPNSYRPISLTSCLCKLNERIIVNRLLWYLETHNLLNPSQTGFRYHRNTVDQLIRLHDSANKAISTNSATFAIFLDFSKAFDTLWRPGLLYKLRKLKIHGNLYNWINNFLTNRTLTVKINNAISIPINLQNGVPQGSVISPILFILLMNDFPTLTTKNIETSLYADDSALWKSGKNLKLIKTQLQDRLDLITKWANKWGLKLNEAKTTSIIFTRKRNIPDDLNLQLNNTPIPLLTHAKFLGLTFDKKLNWTKHIDNVITKTSKFINLLKYVASKSWGNSKSTLLTIYKSIIRSRLDYGSEIFHTASPSSLKKLDQIQYRALKICTKALSSTPLTSLQQECGEPPLDLHRHRILLRHMVRISTNQTNPANTCLKDTWHNYYGKFKKNKNSLPILLLLKEAKSILENYTDKPIHISKPHWHIPSYDVDHELSELISKKHDSPTILLSKTIEHITKYQHHIAIYTDGSRDEHNHVGLGLYIPTLLQEVSLRIPDKSSVYTAELLAIKAAIEFILQQPNETNLSYVIFSDSLSAIHTLTDFPTRPSDSIIRDLTYYRFKLLTLNINLKIVWIPSHVGIRGNSIADDLAKKATNKTDIDIPLQKTMQATLNDIDEHINHLWQIRFSNSEHNEFYKKVEPYTSHRIKFTSTDPIKEKTITRIRFGIVKLNYYLYKIKKHPDGLCKTCNVPETITHFLTNCPIYNFNLPTHEPLHKLLKEEIYLNRIYSIIKKRNINI